VILKIPDLREAINSETKPSLRVDCCRAQFFVAIADRPVSHSTAMAMLKLARTVREEWKDFIGIRIGGHVHFDTAATTEVLAQINELKAERVNIWRRLLAEGRLSFPSSLS
jgi:hypothetical protein